MSRRQRRYFVNMRYQMGRALVAVAGNALVAVLMAVFFAWFYLLEWDGAMAYDHNRTIPVYVMVIVGLVIAVSALFSLRRSRAVAGMMHKLHTVLDEAGKGRFPERDLAFRKSDYFRQVATPLNACLRRGRRGQGLALALRALDERIEAQNLDRAEILRCIRELQAEYPPDRPGEPARER